MKRTLSVLLTVLILNQAALPVSAGDFHGIQAKTAAKSDTLIRNIRLIEQKNQAALLAASQEFEGSRKTASDAVALPAEAQTTLIPALNPTILLEAGYTIASQHLADDAAHGAINNVYGDPTWIVPRENALAILNFIQSAEITGNAAYLDNAVASADYLVRVQDADGGWYDQYAYDHPVVFSKSPTQTAEVMIAFFKLGYSASRYESMKKGAAFLMACQDPANKGGLDDGLLGGGKDDQGNFHSWRWASDNSFAYLAMKAMQAWAVAAGDTAFSVQSADSAARILNGINTVLYNDDPLDDDYGVWKRAVDGNGIEQESYFHEWINYAPQMLDLPATGVGSALVGEWIHRKFQQNDGAVVWNDTWHSTRKSPGFSFQAAFVWYDLGQTAYADAAVDWAVNSGLWQTTPDQSGVVGGWIDWVEPADQAPYWQRFIDTSFYSISAFNKGYNFFIGEATTSELLLMRLQGNDEWRTAFNLLFGTHLNAVGAISSFDAAALHAVTHDASIHFETFFTVLPKAAELYADLQSVSGRLADFNLLYAAALKASGAPAALDRGKLFDIAGDPAYEKTAYLTALPKAASLYRAIKPSTGYRADFNVLFHATVKSTGALTVSDRALIFGVVGDPAYDQTAFLKSTAKTADLFRALRAAASRLGNFNLLYGTSLSRAATLSASDRTLLYTIAGTPGYVQSIYLGAMTRTAGLYKSFQKSSVYLADFNLLYGSDLAASGSPTATQLTLLFGIAGKKGFSVLTYLPRLRKTSSLYTKLLADAAKRASFNTRYDTLLPAAGSPSASDLTVLFKITGGASYNETKFLKKL